MNATRPKLHHLNWNLLHTFLVIVEERSITKAADRLLVRQPSVSAALQRLEETLGSQLIQRDSRRFVLTKRGELLYKECVDIYRSVARIGDKLSEEHDELTGLVRVLVVTHVVMPVLDRSLTLLNRHGFLDNLPDRAHPAYQSVMRRIGASALRGQSLLARSEALDKDTLLAVMPEHNKRLN